MLRTPPLAAAAQQQQQTTTTQTKKSPDNAHETTKASETTKSIKKKVKTASDEVSHLLSTTEILLTLSVFQDVHIGFLGEFCF